jgi:BirA family biotin operon repressor/biotin-[acetyl-CoA-carboxylase] ligase
LAATNWSPVTITPATGSTNADLLAGLRAGSVTTGAVEVAAEQASGRGRLTRSWSSPPGRSVALSAVVTPPAGRAWTLLPLLSGLAVAEAVTALGAPAQVKWPNDVVIDGLKCCGILVETVHTATGLQAVVGIGLNIGQTRDELPGPAATSLALAGLMTSRERAAAAVLRQLEGVLNDWRNGADVLARYRDWSATLGQSVRLTLAADHVVEGEARAIAADGQLGVVVAGRLRWFAAGDVHHLRPTRPEADSTANG